MKNSNDTSWNRTSDLPICSTVLPRSPFNTIYTDETITNWQTEDLTGIPLSKNQQLLKLLIAADQAVTSSTEEKLQNTGFK